MARCILIVDDEVDVLTIVRFRLQKAGYDVALAVDGAEALAQVEAKLPDLILLDLRLPVLDGYEVCRRIKNHPTWKKTPVILFTASTHLVREEQYKSLGAEDFITKPFEWENLARKIERLLAQR